MSFSAAVLTGGAGRRMGATDKALVLLGGRPMAAYALSALQAAGASEVLAVGSRGQGGVALEALGFVVVADPRLGEGPLAGIVEALAAASSDPVVVLGCDTPFVSPATIRRLVDAARGDGSVASAGGRAEPLIAAYRRGAAGLLADALGRHRAVHRGLAGLDLVVVSVDPAEVFNVNTPEDLAAAERRLSGTAEGAGLAEPG